ncbi:ribonucleases P/MRP protein subunit POP1 [Podospora fimiseda]|uniref:Ribonucleases P/MRP protein subunit POP1 n=1 Tax=Podospora fimiseda TaxID=252190 RepID=A0AAN7BUM2_9PEZI|nr:ribonucleases P/MRP protein subunit POP1 [Podospora fimiseda]
MDGNRHKVPGGPGPSKRKELPIRDTGYRSAKRVKINDARNIRTQKSDAALEDGRLDLQKFLNTREFEIKALQDSMRKCKGANATRVFQSVPREMRRRTASHNVKRVPKRLRARAWKEMIEDNTPTVESRKRRPRTTRARIRAETIKRLRYLAEKKKKQKLQKKSGDESTKKIGAKGTVIETRPPRPKIRRDMLNEPPKTDSKFKKRQINKTWLPTHLWHAKRATMTEPSKPLWGFSLPLTPTAKCYRSTHRASGQKGVVVWDTSYMSTASLYGTSQGIERVLKALGLTQESLWGSRGQKWRSGLRKWTGVLSSQRGDSRRDIAPATIVWNPEPPARDVEMDGSAAQTKKPQRQVLFRIHPSAFIELFEQLLKLVKMETPRLHVEDLRYEIGSIELTGPGSTETLLGVLQPFHDTPDNLECHGQVFQSLAGVTNPATLPKDALLAFSVKDPRLSFPPKRLRLPGDNGAALLETLTKWPVEENLKPFDICNRESRYKASKLPSQKTINRRKGSNPPGQPLQLAPTDPSIPVMLLASRSSADGQAQGTWTMLAPWKCIQAIWYCMMHYPLTTGGNPRLGGLEEQRQIAFEHGTPWFPGDFPATNAGLNWELEQRLKRKRDWDRRPKGKRIEWNSLDLGAGRKGEVGDGLACDFEHLFCLPKPCTPPTQETGASNPGSMDIDPSEKSSNPRNSSLPALSAIQRVSKPSFNALIGPGATGSPPANSVITVGITFVARGVASPCARIYRLPTRTAVSVLPSTQAEVPATDPSVGSGSMPHDLKDQWLAKLLQKSANAEGITRQLNGVPRMPPGVDMETRKKLLAKSLITTELPYPRPPANQTDIGGHPLCPDEKDLIGFVTTGSFCLSEGKGTAIGSISAEKALETVRETGTREGRLCITESGCCISGFGLLRATTAKAPDFLRITRYPYNHIPMDRDNHRPSNPDQGTQRRGTIAQGPSFMAPSPLSPALADPADNNPVGPPELSDVDYLREVLLVQSADITEDVIERELVDKAAALGVDLPIGRRLVYEELNHVSADDSAETLIIQHNRTISTSSNATTTSGLTSRHSTVISATLTESSSVRRRSRSLTFSHYEKYLSQINPALDQPRFHRLYADKAERSGGLLRRSGTRKGVQELKRSITNRLKKRKPNPSSATPIPCICCREDFTRDNNTLQTLPCGHTYCVGCLEVMIAQSTTDESKMPPRCCTQPIPSGIIKTVLPKDKQQLFLKAVQQFSTPWEARVFCPNTACNEFIPPPSKLDPKHPFEAICKYCKTKVCTMCKRNSHRLGQDCPEDRDLDAVLKIGETSGWRRCYKCRTLVELVQGCTHITCRCKAQFCYICGAVWDPAVGCPNFCNGEEELERRRMLEEARLAEIEAEELARVKAAEAEELARQEAERRTAENSQFKRLRKEQEAEMNRFRVFEQKAMAAMRARQSSKKLALVEKYSEQVEKMRERHAKTEQHLEDRQVLAEFELHASLEEKEKKIRLKLRYMEEYVNGNNKLMADKNRDSKMPVREITMKDREQLRQQYCIRDGMERRHQSQVNVLREKQAKALEELVERHAKEMNALVDKRAREIENLAIAFADEEEAALIKFRDRKARLEGRWRIASEMLRVKLEKQHEVPYAASPLPVWPEADPDVVTSTNGE